MTIITLITKTSFKDDAFLNQIDLKFVYHPRLLKGSQLKKSSYTLEKNPKILKKILKNLFKNPKNSEKSQNQK